MTMVERVARAMFVADCDGQTNALDAAWELTHEGEREAYRALARAAIEAMREPTEGMFQAGKAVQFDVPPSLIWKAMLDAALTEGEG